MNQTELTSLLKEQLRQSSEREQSLREQIERQSVQITRLSYQLEQQAVLLEQQATNIKDLTVTIQSMEESMRLRDRNIESLKAQNRALGKLISNKSEKITVDSPKTTNTSEAGETSEACEAPEAGTKVEKSKEKPPFNPKDRGNNNAKRKEFFDIETVIEDIYPNDPAFDREKAKVIGYSDSILYKFIPGKFIKHISRQYNCVMDGKAYSGKATQKAPLLNSNYDSSFIAGMLQLRYVYSMPVERIINYFTENGFELPKPTAHGLIHKAALMMERFEAVLRKVILEDDYICMDETYYTILTGEKNKQGKGVRKGYIWAALARHTNLVQFFYEDGSRTTEVLTGYLQTDYHGAVQSDGLANYKVIESEVYPDAIRLACFQHCKRKFLEIMPDKHAEEIISITNLLYHEEHKIQPDWTPEQKLAYRQEYAPPILEKLKNRLTEITGNPSTLPKSPLAKAANYMLGQFDALKNYIIHHDYDLDNNAIERVNRYISIGRRNSLFCGSHAGAKRMALIYSLACSCRLNNINTFQYFSDILNRLVNISPNAPDEVFINLLPHRWQKLE
jgi:hypothetical protein